MDTTIHEYFSMDNYYTRTLTISDELILQNLCENCSDYYYIIEGRFPEKNEGYKILTELPPDKDYQDKFVLGVFNQKHELRGVLDIVKDYPVKWEWIIGLLMLNPSDRGKALGKVIHDCIVKWAFESEAVKLRICVAEDNTSGYQFWTKLGYIEVKRVNMKMGNKDNVFIIMNYHL